ncbi:hypothetical protein Fbal_2387 [Ferrimonas balearica DSM 9799]|uniref:Uncharacterized protein n=1 Tax=Ferrimonas balearica (strain DSM 9799 / CCM 4581 / KCTC 23876 / PAT) TaxID=550540 RepID=E1SM71_FERBD|nr:hypothetical protein Fbal_2387 [Ferrimonas balearica DSM 9799]
MRRIGSCSPLVLPSARHPCLALKCCVALQRSLSPTPPSIKRKPEAGRPLRKSQAFFLSAPVLRTGRGALKTHPCGIPPVGIHASTSPNCDALHRFRLALTAGFFRFWLLDGVEVRAFTALVTHPCGIPPVGIPASTSQDCDALHCIGSCSPLVLPSARHPCLALKCCVALQRSLSPTPPSVKRKPEAGRPLRKSQAFFLSAPRC